MTEGIKCMSGILFKSHVMCAMYKVVKISKGRKGKQAGWVIHLLCQFYSPVITFHLYSGFFRQLERW